MRYAKPILVGREPVGLEQSCPPIANPLEAAAYSTDLSTSDNKDILTKGLENPVISGFVGLSPNNIVLAPAEVTSLSAIPIDRNTGIIIFYHNKQTDKVHIRIQPPGERLNIVDRPATEAEKLSYPKQWSAFFWSDEQIHKRNELKKEALK